MKKTTTVLAAILLSATLAHANLITVDVGPTRNHVPLNQYQEFIVPYAAPVSSVDGQMLSLDFAFNDHHSIHLFPGTSRIFDVGAVIQVFHNGPMQYVGPFEAWTVDANGNRNSAIVTNTTIGTGTSDGVFNYLLGGLFPVLGGPSAPFDIYGLHIDLTLPDLGYPVLGGEFILAPNGWNAQSNRFAVGPIGVPESGSTLMLLAGAVAVVIFLRRRICT